MLEHTSSTEVTGSTPVTTIAPVAYAEWKSIEAWGKGMIKRQPAKSPTTHSSCSVGEINTDGCTLFLHLSVSNCESFFKL